MRTRIWLAAVAVLGIVGCGGSTTRTRVAYDCQFTVETFGYLYGNVETDWVGGVNDSVPAGVAACIEGPYPLPDGGDIVFDITDTYGDDMDVSAVPNGAACDGSTGYGILRSTLWSGTQSSETGALPSGLYSLAVTCYN